MDLTDIKGIGESRKKSFEENGIFSIDDLINYFPYKYYDFSKTEPYADDGKIRLIKATATETPKIVKINIALSFVTCKMIDEIGHCFNAIWYNQNYIKSQVYLGSQLYLYGKNNAKKKNTFIVNIYKFLDKFNNLGLLPVYKTINGIGQKTLHDSIDYCLQNMNLLSIIPDDLLYKYNLLNLNDSYNIVHNPKSFNEQLLAHKRIQVEKLIPLLAINEYNKLTNKTIKTHSYKNTMELKSQFEKLLPFSITPDQRKSMGELEYDMSSKFSMNRLLQGDVGSGKTVVSMFGAYITAKNGYQAVIIAPTEILANQHYQTANSIFKDENFDISLLTGSVKGLEKQSILNNIASGESKIIIATHAVLSENVEFNNLTYVVVDEQHRFGVVQRAKISKKGENVDYLVMSATPIPRTLTLAIYGNLEVSTINSRPKQNLTQTNIVSASKQNDMWNFIKQSTENGSKCYVVCSKIDEENENDSVIVFSAKNMYDLLAPIFGKENIGLIHGKLSKETQNKTIENFKTGKIKVLVSTTIVEVGVDIPDSDLMVIATPERFGLATLHQLRGRIGRNGKKAYCFCLANNLNEYSLKRIEYFKNHSNGFEIADFDLQTRGSRSLIGTNQHGIDTGIFSHFSIEAFNLASEILEQLKLYPNSYAKILEIGNNTISSENYQKIVMN